MNTERLHAITEAVLNDLKNTKTLVTLEQLAEALQNQVNSPQTAQYQQQVSERLQALDGQLLNAPSNTFSPMWQQALQELGLFDLLGERLRVRVKEIFERNQITPTIALDELRKLLTQLKAYNEALEKISAGFKQMKIGAEKLNPGQCEVGVLIPSLNGHDKLDEFADDLNDMNRMFGAFSELATSERPGFEIRSISSSEINIFLEVLPAVATTIVLAVDRIVNTYKNIVEIRARHEELKKLGLTKDELKGLQKHADSRMKTEIDKIAKELIEEYYKSTDSNRRHELEQDLRGCLTKIAKRIDKGYGFEVRAEPLSQKEVAEQNLQPEDSERIKTILSMAKNIEFLKLKGEPMLSLPENLESQESKKEK